MRCAPGSYTDLVGASTCTACPPGTTTAFNGATDKTYCTLCAPGLCNHGSCAVSESYSPECTCNVGFAGITCSTNVVGIAFGSVVGGLAFIAFLAWVGMRFRKRLRNVSADLSLKERLLSSTSTELAALERVLQIQADELTLTRLVDSGSFGEVWLGEYQVGWLG